ncbi:MAG: hypothetical protein MZU95_12280 [Desulfomicrobium escambiense]|nr:hypothetical protein [Desulfomicrobium escambiense]
MRTITDYAGATQVAAVDSNWTTAAPDAASICMFRLLDSEWRMTCWDSQGTAQAGAADSITLAASAAAVDDVYNGMQIEITGGTGGGQVRTIDDYDGSTLNATVDSAWTTQPDITSFIG